MLKHCNTSMGIYVLLVLTLLNPNLSLASNKKLSTPNDVFTKIKQTNISPTQALKRLKTGNKRFLDDRSNFQFA